MPGSLPTPQVVRFDALGVVDGVGAAFSPGSVLIRRADRVSSVLAVGRTGDVARHEAGGRAGMGAGRGGGDEVGVVRRPSSILTPGFVNTHAHLDLTHIGPRPFDPEGGFVGWIDMVRRGRLVDPQSIAASVRRGIDLSLAAGVVAVGDIGGAAGGRPNLTPWRTLRASGLAGVSFLEFFGIGSTQDRAGAAVDQELAEARRETGNEPCGVRLGLQPHAPNTVGSRLFRRSVELAKAHGLPLATHLAETMEEREFVARGTGPQRDLLERLGIWDDVILTDLGRGLAPAEHLEPVLREAGRAARPFLVAHMNDADDRAIEILAASRTRVAYCPRASAYFGAERVFGPHRYREMMGAGVLVALGTDSIINLPKESAGSAGIGILDEMRFLHARGGTDARALLQMGTVNGATALGLDHSGFEFGAGNPIEGLVAVRVVEENQDPPRAVDERDLAEFLLSARIAVPELLVSNNSRESSGNSGS